MAEHELTLLAVCRSGNLVKIEIPGNMLYLINKRHVADELFEARSAIYCSRPNFVMSGLCVLAYLRLPCLS